MVQWHCLVRWGHHSHWEWTCAGWLCNNDGGKWMECTGHCPCVTELKTDERLNWNNVNPVSPFWDQKLWCPSCTFDQYKTVEKQWNVAYVKKPQMGHTCWINVRDAERTFCFCKRPPLSVLRNVQTSKISECNQCFHPVIHLLVSQFYSRSSRA